MSVSIRSFSEQLHSPHLPIKSIALKEWAVCIEALSRGDQLILVRKGGIQEETRDFRLEETSFYLYPTYEHQRADLLKPAYRDSLQKTLDGITLPPQEVQLSVALHVTDDMTTHEQEDLQKIDSYHILAPGYAAERLNLQPQKPLHLLVVRAYRLNEPVTVPVEDAYLGCKSWLQLKQEVHGIDLVPVLSDAEFRAKREAMLEALGISRS